jgi:hypothetical protein
VSVPWIPDVAAALVVALLLLALGACGLTTSGAASQTPMPTATVHKAAWSAFVTFADGVSYQTAVRTVTDLGLQPRTFCEGIIYEAPGAATGSGAWWERKPRRAGFRCSMSRRRRLRRPTGMPGSRPAQE